MSLIKLTLSLAILITLFVRCGQSLAATPAHTMTLGPDDFLLDGKPFQIRSGEMHPERIPREYWRHRIQTAKAMGLNAVAIYIFWNEHEIQEGKYDFTTGNRDTAAFLKIAHEEGMWVLLRPGPYCCGEWDFGGIPTYLLRYPDLKIRCMDPRYMKAVESYLVALADIVRPYQVSNGGPIITVQIENEYGSYGPGHDRPYLNRLCEIWRRAQITVPFTTSDGPSDGMLKTGAIPGAAVGLDTGENEKHWALARKINPGVPVFTGEAYPGWLTHWGEGWHNGGDLHGLLKFFMDNKKSFNLYVVHGGTNFGFTAGANSGGHGYEPDITSYDYGAPITEQGAITPHYLAMRQHLASYLPAGETLPEIPAPIPAIRLPAIKMQRWTTLWNNLPQPLKLEQLKPFEMLGQNQGLMLYRTTVPANADGKLAFHDLHDYAVVFLDGKYVGTVDRRLGEHDIALPASTSAQPTLEILVEAMGHINFAGSMTADRKGITDRVTVGTTVLQNWELFPFPLADAWAAALPQATAPADRPGGIFKGTFDLATPADTFIDMSRYQKGYVWVNGHNLGRYWQVGPQQRLYCPAPWLKAGTNDITVLDLLQTSAAPITGVKSHTDVADPLGGLSLKTQDATPFEINVPANTVRTKDIPWPAGATVVAAHLDPMQDSAMAWGVGLALGWADEKYVQVNARSDGHWGLRHNGNEQLAGTCPKGTPATVAIKLAEHAVQLLALPDGATEWMLLAEFPRHDYPGLPTTIRLGKIGGSWQPRDHGDKGSTSPCRVDWVKVY